MAAKRPTCRKRLRQCRIYFPRATEEAVADLIEPFLVVVTNAVALINSSKSHPPNHEEKNQSTRGRVGNPLRVITEKPFVGGR